MDFVGGHAGCDNPVGRNLRAGMSVLALIGFISFASASGSSCKYSHWGGQFRPTGLSSRREHERSDRRRDEQISITRNSYMPEPAQNEASKPNPALEPFSVLI